MTRAAWVAARNAVAEQLLRTYAETPVTSLDHLRDSIVADDLVFEAAVQSLVAKGRLPARVRPKSKNALRAEREERLLAHLRASGGCPTDGITLSQVLGVSVPYVPLYAPEIIESLVKRGAIVASAERVVRPPDDACLRIVLGEVTAPKFFLADIAGTTAASQYAECSGLPARQAALIIAQALERRSEIVNVGDGEYRSRLTVDAAIRRIRDAFEEYRPYSSQELEAAANTDDQTLRHVLGQLQKNGTLRTSGDASFKPTSSLSGRGWSCCECGDRTLIIDIFNDRPLCHDCRSRLPQKYGCITKTRALREFRLREHELYRLAYVERENPHYKRAAPMHLFSLRQVQSLAKTKWGSDEPYQIAMTEVSPEQLRWFSENPERLHQLTPERFELLLANRFEAMGLCVQLVGRTNEHDGGIDLIAYPDPRSNQPKYLLAVQAEHHRTERKTGAPKVQKFVGAMTPVQHFRFGFVVTNTTFTWNAEEYARHQSHFVKLRSLSALVRWLRDDFNNEAEWQEIPDFIEFGGFRVPILKPKPPTILL